MIRSRIRQKQMALARSRMMADVPKATVVVTNPVHVAVALRYVAGESDAQAYRINSTFLHPNILGFAGF